MSGDTLFELPDEYRADPPARRRTVVREHSRVLPPGATPRVEPTARRSDPPASHQAARIAAPTSDNWRGKALLAFVDHGAMTHDELAKVTGKKKESIGVRAGELKKLGLLEATGEKRPSPDGVPATVWRVTEAGIAKARELRGTA